MTDTELNFKQLFITWLKDAAIEATKKASKSALLYNKAVVKLNQFQLPITNIQDLKLIPYIGEKTLSLLLDKLKNYCHEENVPFPSAFSTNVEESNKRKKVAPDNPKPVKKHKSMNGLPKPSIIPTATKYCDRSFSANPGAKDFYSAWDGYKVLEKNDLIVVSGRAPKIYTLTEEGFELAQKLKQAEGIESSPVREGEVVDVSMDNGVRMTPNKSGIDIGDINVLSSPLRSKTSRVDKDFNARESLKSKISRADIEDVNSLESQSKTAVECPPVIHNRENPLTECIPENPIHDRQNPKSKTPSPESPPIIHDRQNRVLNNIDYTIWNYDEYDVVLVVDNREINGKQDRDFFQRQLDLLGVTCEVLPLTIGDVLWVARHKVSGRQVTLNCIGERKRIDDLVSSIIDGRYQEQKNRLLKTEMKHYFYILEERQSDRISEMMMSIQSAISQTMTSSGFYVRMFKDIDGIIQFLASTTNAIRTNLLNAKTKLVVMKPKSIHNHLEYETILNQFRTVFESLSTKYQCVFQLQTFIDIFAKGDMLTVKELYILMLMTIRGVTLERAIAIQSKFPTPKLLLEYYHVTNKDVDEKSKKNLMDKEFAHMVGNKKIGKATLERIYDIWGI